MLLVILRSGDIGLCFLRYFVGNLYKRIRARKN